MTSLDDEPFLGLPLFTSPGSFWGPSCHEMRIESLEEDVAEDGGELSKITTLEDSDETGESQSFPGVVKACMFFFVLESK
jgi:hypothetical protein